MASLRGTSVKRKTRIVEVMMVFDLDGVVTDPTASTNEINAEVIAAIAEDLRRHIPVAFNTGRALNWVETEIFPFLQKLEPEELACLLIVCEKGGLVAEFRNGKLHTSLDKNLSLPKPFAREVQQALAADRGGWKFDDYMFWDTDKLTMGSIEKLRDKPIKLSEFHKRRDVLLSELEKLMQKHQLSDFKIDATVIATDIEYRTAGKHRGAGQVLDWLERRHISPKEFITYGDSPSDAEMAHTFSKAAPTKFVYVGDADAYQPPKDAQYETFMMRGGYSADTFKHLTHLQAKRRQP